MSEARGGPELIAQNLLTAFLHELDGGEFQVSDEVANEIRVVFVRGGEQLFQSGGTDNQINIALEHARELGQRLALEAAERNESAISLATWQTVIDWFCPDKWPYC